MGCLIGCETSDFLLRKAHFADALGALHQLAREQDEEFHEPTLVLGAKSLVDALDAAFFSATCDDAGDLIQITYSADKAPSNSGEQWPDSIFFAIAPWIERGSIRGSVDDYAWEMRIVEGRVL